MAFKQCSTGTKGPNVCQENIPHIFTPPAAAWTVGTRLYGSMPCSLSQIWPYLSECRSRNRDSSDQATFFQSSIVQLWWACVNCSLSFLFLADRSGTRCSLLLLQPICFRVRRDCAFRDGILHTLVIMSGYLSYCCLSIISNQATHCPLISDINKGIFSGKKLPLTGYFLFIWTILCKP